MKSSEVVLKLQETIPQITGRFSDSNEITSMTCVSGLVTCETVLPHGLAETNALIIKNSESDILISSAERVGVVLTVVTATDHDLTNGLGSVELFANESEFTGVFKIQKVLNRRVFKVFVLDSGPTVGTGRMIIVNGESAYRGYNGIQTVNTVVSETIFTFMLSGVVNLLPAGGNPTLELGVRISAAGNFDRLLESYTENIQDSDWMFVVLGDVAASKSRSVKSDAVDDLSRGQQGSDFKQQLIQPITIYVFTPTSSEITSRKARDQAEDNFYFICKSILFCEFNSGLSVEKQGALMFTDHGFQAYSKAFYVHQYTFEQVVDLTFNDTIGYSDDVAFRDISLNMNLAIGNEPFSAEINLDDEAL